jgi:hypothetical protein
MAGRDFFLCGQSKTNYLFDAKQPEIIYLKQSLISADFKAQMRNFRSMNYNEDLQMRGEIIYRKYKPGEQSGMLLGTSFHKSADHSIFHNGSCRGVVVSNLVSLEFEHF